MAQANKLKISRILFSAAILLIVAFQSYWLNRLYRDERQGLKKETNNIFRDVMYNVQMQRFQEDTLSRVTVKGVGVKRDGPVSLGNNLFAHTVVNVLRKQTEALSAKNKERLRDSLLRDSSFPGKAIGIVAVNVPAATIKPGDTLREVVAHSVNNGITPELAAKLMLRGQLGKVKLPALMDSGMMTKMTEEGANVIITMRKNDSIVTFSRSAANLAGVTANAINSITIEPSKSVIKGVRVGPRRLPDNIVVTGGSVTGAVAGGSFSGTLSANTLSRTKTRRDFNPVIRLLTNGRVIDDTIPVRKLDSTYRAELAKAGIPVNFYIKTGKDDSLHWRDTIPSSVFATEAAGAGLIHSYWYQAGFEDPTAFLLKKISLQLLFSVALVAFTFLAFLFIYRNLVAQRKLTEIKNDFISNITHELKTPLATVSVAVEALRSFGGIQNPERTKEYLDISASELQRLSLLVDKVLKLSLFENRELELKKEIFDLKQLTEEVLNTMKLQFETHKAKVKLDIEGNHFTVHADRLHITSVIFNLLDNALKYSRNKPEIHILLLKQNDTVLLQVRDNGIGISDDYKTKIFDKFFRVPTGDHHNIKGYGLGLSYVAHVVHQHGGTISVDSQPQKGSTFNVKFPTT